MIQKMWQIVGFLAPTAAKNKVMLDSAALEHHIFFTKTVI